MQDVFTKFASKTLQESFTSYEYIEYLEEAGGSTRGQFNASGQALRMRMTDRDSISFPADSFLQVRYTVEQNAATQTGTALPVFGGSIAPVNNGWNLFRAARYLLNQEIISDIREPGFVKQVKGLVEYSDDYSRGQGKVEFWDLDKGNGLIEPTSQEILGLNTNRLDTGVVSPIFDSMAGTAGPPHRMSFASGIVGSIYHLYYKGERLTARNIATFVSGALVLTQTADGLVPTINTVAVATTEGFQLLYRGEALTNMVGTAGFTGVFSALLDTTIVTDFTDGDNTVITSVNVNDLNQYEQNVGFNRRRERLYADQNITSTDNAVSLFIPLRTLFGILRDNPIPMRGLDQELQLDRNVFSNMLFRDTGIVGNLDAKIIFHHLSWWVPIIQPTLAFRNKMDERLASGVPIDMIWDESNHYVRDASENVNPTIDILTTSFKPQRCYVFLQLTSRNLDQTQNNMIFDALDLQRIYVRVNSDRQYPRREYTASFTPGENQDYSRVYSAFLTACNMVHSSVCKPSVSYEEFRNLYQLFFFDMTFREEGIWTNTSVAHINITLTLGTALTPGAGYRVHMVIDTERKISLKGVDKRMIVSR
ncbi:MAG: hypothetical protein V3W20_11780 [Candidatus Neomarinimicrobiota bacterium]